jgi:hypothetical protein
VAPPPAPAPQPPVAIVAPVVAAPPPAPVVVVEAPAAPMPMPTPAPAAVPAPMSFQEVAPELAELEMPPVAMPTAMPTVDEMPPPEDSYAISAPPEAPSIFALPTVAFRQSTEPEDTTVSPEAGEALPPVEEPLPEEPERDDTPLTFVEAKELLAGVGDRNAIARIVLRFGRSIFKRVVLLTVQRDLALGWDFICEGITQRSLTDLVLPLNEPSVFQLARESRAHFLGPLPKQRVNILFLKLTGAQIPRSVVVIPIVARGKVVNLLYADNGAKQEATTDIGELLILAQHINRSYEALLQKAAN